MGMFALCFPTLCAGFARHPRSIAAYLLRHKLAVLCSVCVVLSALFLSELLPSASSSLLFAILVPLIRDYTVPLGGAVMTVLLFSLDDSVVPVAAALCSASLYMVIRGVNFDPPLYHYFLRPLLWPAFYVLTPFLLRYIEKRAVKIVAAVGLFLLAAGLYVSVAYLAERSYYLFSVLALCGVWFLVYALWLYRRYAVRSAARH